MFQTTFDKEQKQWYGPQIEMDWVHETSLGSKILHSLKSNGPKVAQICAVTGETRTFEELHRLTVRAAINLRKFGCERGSRIFLLSDNITDLAPLTFAALCLSCPLVPLVNNSSQNECEYFINITRPEFAICEFKYYPMLEECFAKLNINAKIFTINGQAGDSISTEILFENVDNESDFEPEEVDTTNETAFIMQTSGTTGLNKGLCISHATILDKMESLNQIFTSTDTILKFSSIHGVAGVRCLFGATFYGGKRLVNTGPFSPKRFFDFVERFKVTMTYTSIFEIAQMLHDNSIDSANLDSLTLFQCGDANISLQVIERFGEYLKNAKFSNTYGLTESYGTIACNLEHTRNNCVGQLLCNHEAKIVNEKRQRLGVNETGELCIKFAVPFPGYLNKENEMHLFVDDEGFYMTGDEARFDENGDLFVDDRMKEIFKSRGIKVSPADVEAFINNIEGVQQSCVVPIPSELYGYLPAAVIIKSENSTCTEQSIYDCVAKFFAINKRLDGGIYFVDQFPMNCSGKITRFVVKKMAVELFNNRHKIRSAA